MEEGQPQSPLHISGFASCRNQLITDVWGDVICGNFISQLARTSVKWAYLLLGAVVSLSALACRGLAAKPAASSRVTIKMVGKWTRNTGR